MISIIVSMSKNRVIGNKKTIPWHISEDLIRFSKITAGHPIIMGQTTHESISNFNKLKGWTENKKLEHKLLPGRTNIILSIDKNYDVPGGIVVNSIKDALKKAKTCEGNGEIFFIGGASIYEQTIKLADRLYITQIEEIISGDTYFPKINAKEWKLVSEQKRINKVNDKQINYSFLMYERPKE